MAKYIHKYTSVAVNKLNLALMQITIYLWLSAQKKLVFSASFKVTNAQQVIYFLVTQEFFQQVLRGRRIEKFCCIYMLWAMKGIFTESCFLKSPNSLLRTVYWVKSVMYW